MSKTKEIKKEELSKASGGYPGARFIEIPYDIKCSHCDYVGHMTYEEGTENGVERFVYAYCPKCGKTTLVGLGTK